MLVRPDDPVERVLEPELPALAVGRTKRHEREAAEVLGHGALSLQLEQPRHDRDRYPELPGAPRQGDEPWMLRAREGDDQVLDPLLLDHRVEVVPAVDAEVGGLVVSVKRIVVEEPDRHEAERGV